MVSTLLLTGKPGVGKTTALKDVVRAIGTDHCGGFYTEEVMERGTRVGFIITTLNGDTDLFAYKEPHTPDSVARVGDYLIRLEVLEGLGLRAIKEAIARGKVLIIDEIGPMQLQSSEFRQVLQTIITMKHKLIGTVVLRPHPVADTIKHQAGTKLLHLTRSNRDQIVDRVLWNVRSWQM